MAAHCRRPRVAAAARPNCPAPRRAPALKDRPRDQVRRGRISRSARRSKPARPAAPTPRSCTKHFSSITAENAMKPDTHLAEHARHAPAQPAAQPNFGRPTRWSNFATANNMQVRGHTLLWHRTVPTGCSSATSAIPLTTACGAAAPARLHHRGDPALPERVRLGRRERSRDATRRTPRTPIAPTASGTRPTPTAAWTARTTSSTRSISRGQVRAAHRARTAPT